jgi:hypothetical protein
LRKRFAFVAGNDGSDTAFPRDRTAAIFPPCQIRDGGRA